MDDDGVDRQLNRRKWLVHCTAPALAVCIGPALAAPAAGATGKGRQLVLVVGDSLSAEYGLARGSGWVALLEKRLVRDAVAASVVNASISGDTTSGGRSRLAALLKRHQPSVVVLELGANDALRGLPLTMSRDNLAQMVVTAQQAGAKVLIVGMQVPPNYGRKYSDDFAALFGEVARAKKTALVPFLLKGVADATDAEAMFQADRIHPRAEAHPTILANVWPVLRPMLG